MDLYEISFYLNDMFEGNNSNALLKFEPSILDYTNDTRGHLTVENQRQKITVPLTGEEIGVRTLLGILEQTLFNPERVRILFAWSIKDLISYFRFYVPTLALPPVSIIDLKVIESFLGVHKNPPKTYIEAVNRARIFQQRKGWKKVYSEIHQPLMLKVLPTIETTPLLDTQKREWVHPYYEIEGQANGRLNSYNRLKNGYLPHTMSAEVKEVLKPREVGWRFLAADFMSCEVIVLQWLSGDKELTKIIESGKDLHSEIYRVVTQDEQINPTKRNMSKLMFLPVMYGCGPEGLAKQLHLDISVAKELINRIRTIFSDAHDWMMAKQEQTKNQGYIEDYFGRKRSFSQEEAYRCRNFVVQAVAATFCQEKLIQLTNALSTLDANVVFSVHDGFGVVFKQSIAKELYKITKRVLESESKICPGLKILTEIKFGVKLSKMKIYNRII